MAKSTYVLLHRLELKENANQTETVDPYLFEDKEDAISFASHLMRETTDKWGWAREDQDSEAGVLVTALESPPRGCSPDDLHSAHLVHLTDSDNEVFELFRRGTASSGHLYPEVG